MQGMNPDTAAAAHVLNQYITDYQSNSETLLWRLGSTEIVSYLRTEK